MSFLRHKYFIYILILVIPFLIFKNAKHENIKVDTQNYTQIEQKQEHNKLNVIVIKIKVKETTLYDELTAEQIETLARIVMSASGNQTYKGKYLVACVLRNRVNKYGVVNVLTSGHVETPYKQLQGLSEWQSKQVNKQLTECRQAIKQAFSCSDNEDLFYYQNPQYSTNDGLEFFETLQFVIKEDEHCFYKENAK